MAELLQDIVRKIDDLQRRLDRLSAVENVAASSLNPFRVSEVWESDNGAVALQTDANGHIGIGVAPSATVHFDVLGTHVSGTGMARFTGDAENGFLSLDTTDAAGDAGLLLKINSVLVGQFGARDSDNSVYIKNRVFGATDIILLDVNGNTIVTGALGVNTVPAVAMHMQGGSGEIFRLETDTATGSPFMSFFQTTTRRAFLQLVDTNNVLTIASEYGDVNFKAAATAGVNSDTIYITLKAGGNVGLNNVLLPTSELDMGDGVIEFAEMTAPAAGAANSAKTFARDDGEGNTEYCIRFSSGLIQVIAPLQFGEISRTGNTTLTALTVSTPAQYLFFDTNGPSNGATPDHTNDHVTVGKTGTYLIVVSLSAESVAGSAYDVEFTVLKNNGATQVGELHAHRSFAGGGGDFGSISLSGLAVLTAADTIELWVENQTSSQDLRIEDATLSVTMIGVNA